jgi:hypothetical protein
MKMKIKTGTRISIIFSVFTFFIIFIILFSLNILSFFKWYDKEKAELIEKTDKIALIKNDILENIQDI